VWAAARLGTAGRRPWQAARNASATGSVRRWTAVAQPATRREAMSMTVVGYSRSSSVGLQDGGGQGQTEPSARALEGGEESGKRSRKRERSVLRA
jgi:hypothetical protein